jgi:hypothetical protein
LFQGGLNDIVEILRGPEGIMGRADGGHTTAILSAPARTASAALDAFKPPMPTSGWRVAALILVNPSSPQFPSVSVLVGVSKTGLTPK